MRRVPLSNIHCQLSTVLLALAILTVPTLGTPPLDDDQRRAVLAEGLAAYDRGIELLPRDLDAARSRFAESAARFQQLVDDGVTNGLLHYDLGNAELQGGRLGRAILAYRRARDLVGDDPRLESNLAYARSLVRRRIEPAGERALGRALLGWHEALPFGRRLALLLGAWTLFWLLIAAWTWRNRVALLAAAALANLLWLPLALSVGVDLAGGADDVGVVLADEAILRKGNGTGFAPVFEEPLTEGVELEILERRGPWRRVELADGSVGWLEAEVVGEW